MQRRTFLQLLSGLLAGGALSSHAAWAIGPSSALQLALLTYDGNWNPRPNGLRRMLQELEKRTSIKVNTQIEGARASEREKLFRYPLIFWAGSEAFAPLPQHEIDNLALYLRAGGTLVLDSSSASLGSGFITSARREIARVLPGKRFVEIPRSHVLYKSFYLIPKSYGRMALTSSMEAVFGEDRALVLLNENDLQGAWARDNFGNYEFDVFPGGERQREMSLRLGINVVMYALCLDYKEDQVHVPFILKRRKWRIE